MLIVALVLAVIGLAALVTAVVTSNELIAWVCIGASVIGVLLLIVDALRERPTSGAELRRMFRRTHAANLNSYLEGLVKDGLIVAVDDETWSLPG